MSQRIFEVFWSDIAVRDLDQIIDFIEQEAPLAAQRLFDKIAERARTLERLPRRGRVVPELARFDITTYRELIIAPFRLVYRMREDSVLVVAVFDGRRNLEDVLLARIARTSP
ncbi:MAG TPA: type II toxin-antitoxin system RelE/ParE family toxin [Thermoanaerobaculia bacterium]|nr:type II toxin-antitoxin system RelE/ParE family toxin [Thermoanaerobaculia bacterium]